MALPATSLAGVFMAVAALPAFALAWWVSRHTAASHAARLPWPQRRTIAIHMLLAGVCLMGCGLGLHFGAGDTRTAVGLAIAALVLVNALGISLWLRLHGLRKQTNTPP